MLIDLNGVYVNPELVAVARPSELDSDQTVIFTAGASPIDGGHLIDSPVEDVVEAVNAVQARVLAEQLLADMESEHSERPATR